MTCTLGMRVAGGVRVMILMMVMAMLMLSMSTFTSLRSFFYPKLFVAPILLLHVFLLALAQKI